MKAKAPPSPASAKVADKGESAAEASAAKTSATNTSAAASRRGPGAGAIAGSGVLGGVLGAGLMFALAQSGVLAPKQDDSRLAALDQKIASLAPRDAVSALDKRVAANEQAAKSATERANEAVQKAGTPAPTAAAAQAAPAQTAPADLVARLDALDQRVSALQEEPGRDQPAGSKTAAVPAGGDTVRFADLDERLRAIETKNEASPEASPAAPDLTAKLATIQGEAASRAKANETADAALGQKLDQLQQTVDARVKSATEAVQTSAEASRKLVEAGKTQADEAAKAVERRLQEQADRIAALNKTVDGTAKAATVQTALRIVAADRIASALRTGTPYADALASLRNGDPGNGSRFEPLTPFADAGAPTAAALAATFRPIGESIAAGRRAAKVRALAETGGIAERLQSMASSIVQVKRTGNEGPSGTAPAASDDDPTATVQEALDHGRIAEAAKAFAALPDDVRGQTGDFGAKLKARADAEAAAEALQADGFKGLAAGNGR